MISHHPDDDLLISHAAGALEEGWSLIIRAHLAFCDTCRGRHRAAEELGGILLEKSDSNFRHERTLAEVWARIAQAEQESLGVERWLDDPLPEIVRDYLQDDPRIGRGGRFWPQRYLRPLELSAEGPRAWIVRIPAGRAAPSHGHSGRELTIVLQGSFQDGEATYRRGDVEERDQTHTHRPIAGPEEDCVCLMASDAPLIFHSWFARRVQPLLQI